MTHPVHLIGGPRDSENVAFEGRYLDVKSTGPVMMIAVRAFVSVIPAGPPIGRYERYPGTMTAMWVGCQG